MRKVERWQDEEKKTWICESSRGKCPNTRIENDQKSCSGRVGSGIHQWQSQVHTLPNGVHSIRFGGTLRKMQSDERGAERLRSDRTPPQKFMYRTCRGQNCNTCSKCVRCRIGLCPGGRWKRDFGGCRKCIHVQSVWPTGAMRTGKSINCMSSRLRPFRKHLCSKISKNCRLRNQTTNNLANSALGVDLLNKTTCQCIGSSVSKCQ